MAKLVFGDDYRFGCRAKLIRRKDRPSFGGFGRDDADWPHVVTDGVGLGCICPEFLTCDANTFSWVGKSLPVGGAFGDAVFRHSDIVQKTCTNGVLVAYGYSSSAKPAGNREGKSRCFETVVVDVPVLGMMDDVLCLGKAIGFHDVAAEFHHVFLQVLMHTLTRSCIVGVTVSIYTAISLIVRAKRADTRFKLI